MLKRVGSILFIEAPFLTVLGTALVLITLNQIDLELGLFYVMWSPSTDDFLPVFLDGLAAGLLYSTLAYLGYLIHARRDPSAIPHRRALFLCLVAPFIASSFLPILVSTWFPETSYKWSFGIGMIAALFVFWGLVVVVCVSSPDEQVDLFLPAGATGYVLTFSEPPIGFAPADVTELTDPSGKVVNGPITVAGVSATQYVIGFPALAASGYHRLTLRSRLPRVALPAGVVARLATTAVVRSTVTFPTPPAAFTADDVTGVTDAGGAPVPGPFVVTRLSATRYCVDVPSPRGRPMPFQVALAAGLPAPAGQTSTHLVSHTVTFPSPPRSFGASNIAAVTDAAGNAVAGPVTVSRVSPDAHRIDFGVTAPGTDRYHIHFASCLPGVVGAEVLTAPLRKGTTDYVVTFATPPAAFAATNIAGVTDPNGGALPGPFTVTPVSPTQHRITFAAPLVLEGEYAIAFAPGAALAPTTHQSDFPSDREADPPVWLQANGLFAAVLFFFFIPVGYGFAESVPGGWGPLRIAAELVLYCLVTVYCTSPRRVWAVLFLGLLDRRCPSVLRDTRPGVARALGAAGVLLAGANLGGYALMNLWPNRHHLAPVVMFGLFCALVVWGVYWIARAPTAVSFVRHTATTVLVVALGLTGGFLFHRGPLASGAVTAAVLLLLYGRAWFRARRPFADLPDQTPGALRVWLVGSGVVLLLLTWYLVVSHGGVLPAAMSVSLLLAVFAVGYGALHFYAGRWFYPVIVGVGFVIAFVGSVRPFPHRLKVLDVYYQAANTGSAEPSANKFADGPAPAKLAAKPDLNRYQQYHDAHAEVRKARGAGRVDEDRDRLQLDDTAVLAAWSQGLARPGAGKPPLVLVTTAGGASTSALYTFAVLTHLEKKLPGFHRHVRLVTGASGGMLGAAYYRVVVYEFYQDPKNAALLPDDPGAFDNKLAKHLEEAGKALEKNFLSPIVQGFVFKDVPKYLGCPSGYSDDRGVQLESAWQRELGRALDVKFRTLRTQEGSGRFPSLVFSPMMVEDGRPLIISALDLGFLTRTPPEVDRLQPYRAVEFFKLFPEAGWDLPLGTAVRLSATFPYLSPPATIPTLPPRRLVDAGYYDNYGLDIALGWVTRDAGTDSRRLREFTDRVVIVNIRPYQLVKQTSSLSESEDSPLTPEEWECRKGKPGKPNDPEQFLPYLSDPLEPFTTPPDGGNAARKTGMVSRNNSQLALLLRLRAARVTEARKLVGPALAENLAGVPNVEIATFRGNLTSSLNWTLPPGQIRDIREAARQPFRCREPGEKPDEDFQRLLKAVERYLEEAK